MAALPRELCPSPENRNALVSQPDCWRPVWPADSGKDFTTCEASQLQIPCYAPTYRNDLLFTGVDDADLLVLAGGAEEAAIAAPADTKDNIRVHVLQVDQGLSRAHVPNEDLVVAA